MIPGMPNPSMAMEAFMDTPVVNGEAYPYLDVRAQGLPVPHPERGQRPVLQPAALRGRHGRVTGPAGSRPRCRWSRRPRTPASRPPGRRTAGKAGCRIRRRSGPACIQIGTEGGFLPAPVVVPNQPITWNTNPTVFNVGNVDNHALLLAPAERADVIVDFSQYAGKTLILYNDAPAAFPALDPRYDYYTGNPDQTDTGGAPTTQPGYGPNTRTIMQIRVGTLRNGDIPTSTLANLKSVFAKTGAKRGVFEVSQDPIIVAAGRVQLGLRRDLPGRQLRADLPDRAKTFTTLAGTTADGPAHVKSHPGRAWARRTTSTAG